MCWRGVEIDGETSAVRLFDLVDELKEFSNLRFVKKVENGVVIIPVPEPGRSPQAVPVILMHLRASPVPTLASYNAKLAWDPEHWDVVVDCAGEEFKGTALSWI